MGFSDVIRERINYLINLRECGGNLDKEGRGWGRGGGELSSPLIGHYVDLKTDSFARPFADRRRNWLGISEFIGQRVRFAFKVSRWYRGGVHWRNDPWITWRTIRRAIGSFHAIVCIHPRYAHSLLSTPFQNYCAERSTQTRCDLDVPV